jgi:peroxiredoxin
MKTMTKKIKYIFSIILILSLFGCKDIKRQVSYIKHKNHIGYIKSNPDSTESAHRLAVLSTTFGKRKTSELYEILSDSIKNSKDGKLISKYLELNRDPQIGDKFIDFEMENPNGELKRLSDYQGKIILLEFWASWCKGCVYQLPSLKKTYEKYNNSGFEIFAVSYDEEKENWMQIIEEKGLKWQHVSELTSIGNSAGLIYGVYSIPDNFLIDENGIIIARDLNGEDLEKKLTKLINK